MSSKRIVDPEETWQEQGSRMARANAEYFAARQAEKDAKQQWGGRAAQASDFESEKSGSTPDPTANTEPPLVRATVVHTDGCLCTNKATQVLETTRVVREDGTVVYEVILP